MTELLSKKQVEFILGSTKKYNLAWGAVRASKTVCSLFRFMQAVDACPDSSIWMVGHTSTTLFNNVINLLLAPKGIKDPLSVYKPFVSVRSGPTGAKELCYKDKTIVLAGAKDEGALGRFQGPTISLLYCDEMTLFPESIIQLLYTRLSNEHSMLFATMNPSHPNHILKKWIDRAIEGDPLYYQLKFQVEDNPYLPQSYIDDIKRNLTGVYYKRLYLGEWCLAEGAVFDFFDRSIYVVERPPCAANYWILGIDYGTNNAFSAVLIGISTGIPGISNSGIKWAEREYYYNSKDAGRQKSPSEYAEDIKRFIEPYGVKSVYLDPSALFFKQELRKLGIHPTDSKNEVEEGIKKLSSELKSGKLVICAECRNLIREIESYVWDPKQAAKGYDEPLKRDDHAIDALRYAIFTHRPSHFDQDTYNKSVEDWKKQQFYLHGGSFR